MDDPEYEENAILGDDVVHHAVIADAETVERVRRAMDRPHLLPADATGPGRRGGNLFEAPANPLTNRGRKLLVGALGRRREAYLVRLRQPISRSGRERPLR